MRMTLGELVKRRQGPGGLPIKIKTWSIQLPGYRLASVNEVQSGLNHIRIMGRLKREALGHMTGVVVSEHSPGIWRVPGPVIIRIAQYEDGGRGIDVPNYYVKPLVDALIERAGGIGVITDDCPSVVRGLMLRREQGETRVEVRVIPFGGSCWPPRSGTESSAPGDQAIVEAKA